MSASAIACRGCHADLGRLHHSGEITWEPGVVTTKLEPDGRGGHRLWFKCPNCGNDRSWTIGALRLVAER